MFFFPESSAVPKIEPDAAISAVRHKIHELLTLSRVRVLMLSIHPQYAQSMLDGIKTIELRRTHSKVASGDFLLFYVTSPIKALKIISRIDKITWTRPDYELWKEVAVYADISSSQFRCYFDGAVVGVAMYLRDIQELSPPIPLLTLKEVWPSFRPPQQYRYLTSRQLSALEERIDKRDC